MNRGRIVVLSGPSGVGKTTICEKLLSQRSDLRYSVSATSRPRRSVEKNGREYIFLTAEEFKQWIEQGRFVEYAEVYGNFYGTPKKTLEDGLKSGYNLLMDVDVQGARKLMNLYPEGIFFYIIPPDIAELERRLIKRDTDHDEVIKNRLAKAIQELEYKKDYRYVIENKDLKTTIARISNIIEKELGAARNDR
ncbi:MAG: guanylate kinase [candidate division WOR-3 bacterium]|nr:MAG: guanylate kinase [candidate division WOR-3 bacterium]